MSDPAIPAQGETLRTTVPDSFDGIRYEIGRIVKYIQEGHKDPALISTAQKIAELAAGTARQLKRKVNSDTRDLIWLEGIHAWCHANFEHISNPVNIELLKTPQRMIRELEIPEALSRAVWEPIRDQMAAAAGKDPGKLKLPNPRITGNSAMAACLVLTLAAAVGITPLRLRFGGHDGTLHYVWGSAHAADRWHDVDILLPKFGEALKFDCYENLDIPL